MFCLENLKSTEAAMNPIGCRCNFKSHGPCLQTWFEQKNQFECPICHTVSIPSPLTQPVQIVYVQRVPPILRYRELTDGQQKCIGLCCISLVGWFIFTLILEYAVVKRW